MTGKRVREIAGVGLLVIGAIGCLLPVLPGIPILLAGIGLLGADHRLVQWARKWLERKGWTLPGDHSPEK